MLPANETPQALVIALLYIAALLGATYLIFKRRDL
jgi:ABC-type transport system involved in multi-copper enzyme maturation permease subunit